VTWGLLFRVRQTLKGSLWVLPVLGGLLGLALGAVDANLLKRQYRKAPHNGAFL